MSFAIVSDIHSNLEALESVFSRIDALGVREVVCLGDVVGYGADPLPVTRLVMQRCKWTILGNHDWGLFHDLDDFNPLAREALKKAGRADLIGGGPHHLVPYEGAADRLAAARAQGPYGSGAGRPGGPRRPGSPPRSGKGPPRGR